MTRRCACGTHHERPQYRPLPEQHETAGDFWKSLAVLVLLCAAAYSLAIAVAAIQVAS